MFSARPAQLRRSDGFTLVELIITIAIIGTMAGLTVPTLFRAKMSGNEASAIGSLRAIGAAQSAYSGSAASGGFAAQLGVLATPCPGQSTAFISAELAADPSMKSGYTIVLAAGTSSAGPADCNGRSSQSGYYLTATPVNNGSGRRAFATTARGVIYFDVSGAAPTEASMEPGGAGSALQ